jgi:hypothetical protein
LSGDDGAIAKLWVCVQSAQYNQVIDFSCDENHNTDNAMFKNTHHLNHQQEERRISYRKFR